MVRPFGAEKEQQMGMRGPKKHPATLRLLNGTGQGRDSGNQKVAPAPPFNRGAPEPPDWLDGEAKAEWDRVVPELERLDLLKPTDLGALVAYCENWAILVDALAA
jgi:phage terminase small subunit